MTTKRDPRIKKSFKRLLTQYLRWLPAKIGMINKGAFDLELKTIYPDDIFIVSYPKSGSTWLSFIVAYMRAGTSGIIAFDEMEKIVPVVYGNQDRIDEQKGNRIIKSHHMLFDYYPRMVYIYRDYRDVLVSFYHYQVKLNFFSGSFSAFIRSKEHLELHGSWKAHVTGALAYQKKDPEKCFMVRYESLAADFENIVTGLAVFCGFNPARIDMKLLEERTSFKALKENEAEQGSEFLKRTNSHFVREGKIGDWKNIFTKEDIDYLRADKELTAVMQTLGYDAG